MKQRRVWGALGTACVLWCGCAADETSEPMAGTGGAAGMAGMAGLGGAGGTAGVGAAPLCVANETQACTCFDGMPGHKVCSSASTWSLCQCAGGSGGGVGGSAQFDPSAEPAGNRRTDIMFEWEQTVSDNCEAGRYEGTFMCTYVGPGGDPNAGILVAGPIVMTLTESENGEFLEITEGRLDGNTYGIINFTSALSGRLNCSTKKFGANAEMGLWGPFIPVNPFDGVLDAQYDPLTSTLTGDWALNEMLTMGICAGPWNARRTGP